MLRYYDQGDFGRIETGFALDSHLWRCLRQQFGEQAGLVLVQQMGIHYPDLASFRKALVERIGERRVEAIPAQLWKQADVGRQRFLEGFEWLLDDRQTLEIYGHILEWSHSVQKQLKTEGLSQQSRQTIKASFEALCCQEPRLQHTPRRPWIIFWKRQKPFLMERSRWRRPISLSLSLEAIKSMSTKDH